MFDFAYPSLLYLFSAVVLFGLLFAWQRHSRARMLKRFGRIDSLSPLMPDASPYKPKVKIALQLLAIAALVMVLARPRYGEKEASTSRIAGIEVMIAFDVSNSMLASSNDDPQGISRLDRARLLLEKLLDKLDGDKVGLVVFAGEAKTQMPLTTDFYTAKIYLHDLSPSMVQMQGTSITDAINLSLRGFSADDKTHKAIILITDAENHEGDAVEAAAEAARRGVQVDVIGVGSAKGAPIPVGGGDYLRDQEGQVVITTFDASAAQAIAKAGGGAYVNGASPKALATLTAALDTLDKSEFKKVEYKASAEQFPTFALLALLLLVIDFILLDRKSGWLEKINFFTKDK